MASYGMDMSCCICMENFGGDNPSDNELGNPYSNVEVVILPCKAHYYHVECIGQWITKQNACPICRIEITLDALKKQKKELAVMMKTIEKEEKLKNSTFKDSVIANEDQMLLSGSGSNINS